MKVLHLRETVPWFGAHSGYEQLTRHVPVQKDLWTVRPRAGRLARYSGSAYARLHGRYGKGATSLSELEFRVRRRWHQPDVSHILYLENHFDLLGDWNGKQKGLVGTIHLPRSIWKPEQCGQLSKLSGALILYQQDIPFFEQYLGKGKVRFIHHGADTEFFVPAPDKVSDPPRVLYGGVYLRNEPMLVRVLTRLAERNPGLKFDLLVPVHHRQSAALRPLLEHPSVTWHAGLSDEQLRDLYQRSYLMLLPMNDSGANTSVVEALSTGLPVATTDVGGIRDYAGGELYPVVANNNDDGMIALVEQYLSNPKWRNEVSQRCRQFVEKNMAWPLVARRHIEMYQALLG